MNVSLEKTQQLLDWLKTKIYLHTLADSAKSRIVKKGQVYRCNLGRGIGSEMEKERPCVILQNDIGNIRSGNTIVAPITHNSASLPCLVPVATKNDALGKVVLDGNVNTSHIVCVSKGRLGDYICTLTNNELRLVDESVAKTLGLMISLNASSVDDLRKKIDSVREHLDG